MQCNQFFGTTSAEKSSDYILLLVNKSPLPRMHGWVSEFALGTLFTKFIFTCSWLARAHVRIPQYDGQMDYSVFGFYCNSTFFQEHMLYDVYCKYNSSIYYYSPPFKRKEESTFMCFSDKLTVVEYAGVRFFQNFFFSVKVGVTKRI